LKSKSVAEQHPHPHPQRGSRRRPQKGLPLARSLIFQVSELFRPLTRDGGPVAPRKRVRHTDHLCRQVAATAEELEARLLKAQEDSATLRQRSAATLPRRGGGGPIRGAVARWGGVKFFWHCSGNIAHAPLAALGRAGSKKNP